MRSISAEFSLLVALGANGCDRPSSTPPHTETSTLATVTPPSEGNPKGDSLVAQATNAAVRDAGPPRSSRIDPDGNDDVDEAVANAPRKPIGEGSWRRVGKAPLALQRICDLTAFNGKLYAAHANQPLGTDGATITRFDPNNAKKPFAVAFDWNRFGEPTKGGGGGQGFLRVRHIGKRLYVPDADPPYGGLGQVDWGTEGYMFISDGGGTFAPPRAPHARPPAGPRDGGAGAGVVPRAYHGIDVVRFRGKTYATTGSVPPKEKAWNGPSPGALHAASEDLSRWTYVIDFPYPYDNAVWRMTFAVRFRDRLYVGLQDYAGRSPYDYVQFAPPAGVTELAREHVKPVRVTDRGAAHTLRWFAWNDRLYWIAWGKDGVGLRVTEDGDTWRSLPMPSEGGVPTDIRAYRGELIVQAERATYVLRDRAKDAEPEFRVIARIEDRDPQGKTKKSPFRLDDVFCSAPLGVLDDTLYAGAQNDGALYRFVEN